MGTRKQHDVLSGTISWYQYLCWLDSILFAMFNEMKQDILMCSVKKRCSLLIRQGNTTTLREAPGGFEDPNDSEDSEGKCRPVNESIRSLVGKNGPEGPGDSDGACEVSFRSREGISCSRALEEESVVRLVRVWITIKNGNRLHEVIECYILTEQGRRRPSSRYLRGGLLHPHRKPRMQWG